VASAGLANPPRGAKPCTEPTEKLIINALLTNLSEKQKLKINCDPSTNRTTPPTYSTKDCLELVLIGGSHTARIHNKMLESGIRVAFLEVPNYMTSKVHAGKIREGLKNLSIGLNTVLMIQVFDSRLYMAALEEGGLIPNCKRVDGSYHMDGDLVLLSKDMQYDLFKQLDSQLQNYKTSNYLHGTIAKIPGKKLLPGPRPHEEQAGAGFREEIGGGRLRREEEHQKFSLPAWLQTVRDTECLGKGQEDGVLVE
jgi:hypothetical protein